MDGAAADGPMSDAEESRVLAREPGSGSQSGKERLEALAREAKPSEVSDAGRRRALEEWEKATAVVARARQMVKDAIRTQAEMAENVVRKLGRGNLRYKDVLYSPSAKGSTIYLRELRKRPHG